MDTEETTYCCKGDALCDRHAALLRSHLRPSTHAIDWPRIIARAEAEAERQARACRISGDRYAFLALDDDDA